MTNPYDPLPQGYLPPDSAYQTTDSWYDPLVTPPALGIGGWFNRIGQVLKLSWRLQLPIFALTHVLPAVVMVVLGAAGVVAATNFRLENLSSVEVAGLLVFGLIYLVVVLFAQVLGYAAATHAATMKAAGLPVTLGQSLTYGLKRMAGLLGWLILAGLLIAAPIIVIVLCMVNAGPAGLLGFLVLPLMAYLFMATALVGPVFLFERRSPIGRSFSLFHRNFGALLGRFLLIFVAMFVHGMFENMITIVTGGRLGLDVAWPVAVVGTLLVAVLELPFTMVQFTAVLVTYAERRSHEAPVTASNLAEELNRPPQLALGQ